MKKAVVFFLIVVCSLNFSDLLAQESLSALINNNQLSFLNKQSKSQKKILNSFDSTFIYIMDTLTVPFFDDFSLNRYQERIAHYNDLDVTFDKQFKLLDSLSLTPLASSIKYSSIRTYRRTYSIDNSSFTDSYLDSLNIKLGDLTSYPVVYNDVKVYAPYYIFDSLSVLNDVSDTIWITSPDIVQDSATQFFKQINDPSKFWIDNSTFHNYDFAISPWSLGVMTFDGLNQYGLPYSPNSNESNYADTLTSKPIDLSAYTASDSLYFSFLFQPGGYGESPDENDSLIVEFFDKTNNKWNHVWSHEGFNDTTFSYIHFPIKNASYYTDAFQFRFKNYGHLSGSFDLFHIDYVSIDFSQIQDTLLIDFAWVYPVKTILKDYTSVPWDHYKNSTLNRINQQVPLYVRNGSNILETNQSPSSLSVLYNSVVESTTSISGFSICNGCSNYAPRTNYMSFHDFSSSLSFDISKLGDSQSFELLGDLKVQFSEKTLDNNSSKFNQNFSNYYSYDDGTAEAAYGVTGAQSIMAVKFEAYEKDTLLGIMTSFVKAANDVSDKLFLLTVWSDDNGKPGNVIYQDDIFFPRTPEYTETNNGFHTYYFKDNLKLPVDEIFYIGWQQFDSDRLNIGFDRNTIKNENLFYSLNDGVTWVQSSVEGIPLFRPLYSTSMDSSLGIKKTMGNDKYSVYPNPSQNGMFHIKGELSNLVEIQIYNLQGKVICSSHNEVVDLSNFNSGVYIFNIITEENNFIIKAVKQ